MGFADVLSRAASVPDDGSVDRSVQKWNTATQALCISAMTIFFGLRVYTRLFILNGFTKEDWTCMGAWLLGIGYSIISLIMGSYGGGMHMSDVPKEDIIPFQKTVYATMVTYGPAAYLTKLSLLWIMTRVFNPYRKAVIFIYIFLGIMLAYYIPAVIVKIRICKPISTFWNQDNGGTCLDQTAIILADAVVSVVSDLIVLVLPLPLTLGLNMPTGRKMRVMGILGAGGLAVACSIVRLALIEIIGQSPDMTMSFVRISMFGNAEIAIGVICACLPALSALVTNVYHEYSSNNKATYPSEYEMNKSRNKSRTDRSRQGLGTLEEGSDKDVLMYNAQGNPKIETSVLGDSARQTSPQNDMMGIVKTVDMSTTVSTNK